MYWVGIVVLCVTSVSLFNGDYTQRLPSLQHNKKNAFFGLDSETRNISASLNEQEYHPPKRKFSAKLHGKVSERAQLGKKPQYIEKRMRRDIKRPPAPQNVSTSLACKESLSCKDKCQTANRVINDETLSCFCDVECVFFKDCCADYDIFCLHHNESSRTPSGHGKLVDQRNKHLWKCFTDASSMLPDIGGVWMIGSCPRSWPDDDVLYRCRNISDANKITKDTYHHLPIYTNNGRVYHNRFCAQCNGVSPSEMKHFDLSFQSCAVSPPQTLSPNQKIDFMFSYCESNKINWKVPANAPRRYCLTLAELFGNCADSNTKDKCINGSTGVVFISELEGNYKNVHCAICNGHRQYKCGPQKTAPVGGITPQPFSVIFDFKNGGSKNGKSYIQVDCPYRQFYDHYLEICREGHETLPISSSIQVYQALLWFGFNMNASFVGSPLLHLNFREPLIALADLFQVNSSQVYDLEVLTTSNKMFNLQFNIRIFFREQNKANDRSSRQSTVHKISFEDILKWESPFDVSLFGQTLTIFKANTRVISCSNLQNYTRSEYNVLQDISAVSIKATGEILHAKDYYTDTESANESQAISVCRLQHQMSNCSGVYIVINEGEFRVLRNKSIFVNASKQIYDLSEYTWQNKSVLVCENFSTHYYKTRTTSTDEVLRILTVVCMSLSIIGLVFFLLTYSLFSELRTPPGLNLMNLSVSLLLGQLLWILGSGQTDIPMACTVIAVVLHYLFLVSFVWTSIIAFDTWRAFSARGRRPFADSRSKRIKHCLRYMAVGWLPAMMYVAACVVLDFTNTVTIGYTSPRACWIADKWAILYYFAVPVSLCLIFNVVFYVLTLRAIRNTTAQARAATDHDTKKNFGIYVRIASLMGFPWVFGFIAPFEWQLLWYPFVLLTGLEGLYVALAFALNQRARTLYKNRFPFLNWSNGGGVAKDSRSTTKSTVSRYTLSKNQCVETKL